MQFSISIIPHYSFNFLCKSHRKPHDFQLWSSYKNAQQCLFYWLCDLVERWQLWIKSLKFNLGYNRFNSATTSFVTLKVIMILSCKFLFIICYVKQFICPLQCLIILKVISVSDNTKGNSGYMFSIFSQPIKEFYLSLQRGS